MFKGLRRNEWSWRLREGIKKKKNSAESAYGVYETGKISKKGTEFPKTVLFIQFLIFQYRRNFDAAFVKMTFLCLTN